MDLLTIAKKIADRAENALSLDHCPQPHVNRTADA